MMYPRLKLARELLRDDGAIFVSIDEIEQARLRVVMDEIFGSENFISDMVWAAGRKNDSRYISISHEYIVCYSKDFLHMQEKNIKWRQKKKGLDEIYALFGELREKYGKDDKSVSVELKRWFKNLPDNHPSKSHKHYNNVDSKGIFFASDISSVSGASRPRYEILHPVTGIAVAVPGRGWGYTLETLQKLIDEDKVFFGEDHTTPPTLKSYLKESEYQTPYSVFYQDGRAATKRLRDIMSGDIFPFPKDEGVVQEVIGMSSESNSLVLDFFAGSGTTGHAVMAQNATDGGNRQYILVQLPEPLDPAKAEQKTAADFCTSLGVPLNIAELTKERLRRAGVKIKAENPMFAGDTGFKVFKLDSSNLTEWDAAAAQADLEQTLEGAVNNIKADRSEQDVLFELLLKLGLELTTPIETRTIAGKQVHSVGAGALVVCLERGINGGNVRELGQGMADWTEQQDAAGGSQLVFLDNGFDGDMAKTNLSALLEQRAKGLGRTWTVRSI